VRPSPSAYFSLVLILAMDSSDSRRARPGDRCDRGHGGVLISPARRLARRHAPEEVPPLTVPSAVSDLPRRSPALWGAALVAVTGTIAAASSFASRSGHGERRDDRDRRPERVRRVLSRVSGSTSGSCTAVAEQVGVRTQVGCGRSGTDRAYRRDRVWAAQEPSRS
jgi:hypothetical protein